MSYLSSDYRVPSRHSQRTTHTTSSRRRGMEEDSVDIESDPTSLYPPSRRGTQSNDSVDASYDSNTTGAVAPTARTEEQNTPHRQHATTNSTTSVSSMSSPSARVPSPPVLARAVASDSLSSSQEQRDAFARRVEERLSRDIQQHYLSSTTLQPAPVPAKLPAPPSEAPSHDPSQAHSRMEESQAPTVTNKNKNAKLPEEKDTEDATVSTQVRRQRKWRRTILCLLFLIPLVIILGVLAWVVWKRQGVSRASSEASSGNDRNNETQAPTPILPWGLAFQQLIADIASDIVPNVGILLDPTTPQHQALKWMATQDDYYLSQLEPNNYNTEDAVLIERYALILLYQTTQGPLWKSNFQFLTNSSVCEWKANRLPWGVRCDFGQDYVQGLSMPSNGMRGSLPTEIALLSRLEELHFDGNEALTGEIPATLYDLSRLGKFSCAGCQLTGTLSDDIARLSHLKNLDLEGNEITGTLPTSLGRLTDLTSLKLNINRLEGKVPADFGRMTKLRTLELSNNQLTGTIPTEVGRMTSLQFLHLEQNRLEGTLPSEFGLLVDLVYLYTFQNQLTGTIPRTLGDLFKLEILSFEKNEFTGSLDEIFCAGNFDYPLRGFGADCLVGDDEEFDFPEVICSCCSYCCDRQDRCEQNTDFVPPTLAPTGQAENESFQAWVERLNASTNLDLTVFEDNNSPQFRAVAWLSTRDGWEAPSDTSGQVWLERYALAVLFYATGDEVSWDRQLRFLSNSSVCEWNYDGAANGANDRGPGVVCHDNGLLAGLYLQSSGLTGSLPTEIGLLSSVENLFLDENMLEGSLPRTLFSLSTMQYLSIGKNNVTGVIPASIGDLSNLVGLSLAENDLDGSLPSEIGLLPLATLLLSLNSLGGSLPTQIGDLTALVTLDLEGNQFTGIIPTEIGRLSNLEFLYLERNFLSGQIPSHIQGFTRMQSLFVHDNFLSGSLPSAFWKMFPLRSLSAFRNNLTGRVPSHLGMLTSLNYLFLGENSLTGPLPRELGRLVNLVHLSVYRNSLTGTIPSTFALMTNLDAVYLERNSFKGNLDPAFCSEKELFGGDLWADCGGNPPEVTCSCCTLCCRDSAICGSQP